MASYTLTVAGPLQPKERPRVTRKGYTYTPRATQDQEHAIRKAWADEVGTWLEGPIGLTLQVERMRPASHYLPSGQLSATGRRQTIPTTRPDLSNQLKSVEDALNGVAWRDDGQLSDIILRRRWANGSGARWTVTVEELSDVG